jgi:class 3 adenylate cyclase
MSTEVDRPWMVTELTPDTKRTSLTDQIVIVFQILWNDADAETENIHQMAQSTDKEDSAEGSPQVDKTLLSAAVKKLARTMLEMGDRRVEDLANTPVSEIKAKINQATKRVGVDRMAILAKKREFLALQESEPVAEQAEPNLDGRRDEPEADPAE